MDYKARFYSPYLNHFIQPDSLIPDPSNPQAWNRYSYVGNRPVNFNDPTGNFACGDGEEKECGTGKKQDPNIDPYKKLKLKKDGKGEGKGGGQACSGENKSVLCIDPTIISTGSVITDPVYPTNQPPAEWRGMDAELTGDPLTSGLLLLADVLGMYHYSSTPSIISGNYMYATVDYEVHSSAVVGSYREIVGITIVNNTKKNMDLNQIRTNVYQVVQTETITIGAGSEMHFSFNFNQPFTGNPVTMNLSNGSYFAQIIADIYK